MTQQYTKEILESQVLLSDSFASVMRNLGMNVSGSNHNLIKRKIIEFNIDYSHFYKSKGKNNGRKKSSTEILLRIPNSVYDRTRRVFLVRAMLELGLEYKCSFVDCENPMPMWRGEQLNLDVDHIDGDWRNCLIDNLRFLCPNCHSQTSSNNRSKSNVDGIYSKLIKKIKCPFCENLMRAKSKKCLECHNRSPRKANFTYPEIDMLIQMLQDSSYLKVSRDLGVSDNAIRKHIKKSGYDCKTLKLAEHI